jgi:glycogen(starch) synthase
LFRPADQEDEERQLLQLLAQSTCPSQVFSWQAARYAEHLIETEPIDLIEAQEWEAPLYYLQVRRAAGLGPKPKPPCLVHLHSPSQMIFDHNEWDETLTDFVPLARFEEYSIRSADALLCPSRYLADGVTSWLHLDAARVHVIPYAMGVETPVLPRGAEVWGRNAICYVGRLELRKGVVEWVDAAIQVAGVDASVSFDFFGSDTSIDGGVGQSVLAFLLRRIPRGLRGRIRFHGSRSREELLQALSQVAVAVVPSQWENFPFTCIEAMSTGLPVLASPNGGMAEMIVDGESGWIAEDGAAAGLAKALLRVLATTPERRRDMGGRAASAIRIICDNEAVVAKHLALRTSLVASGSRRSLGVAGRARQEHESSGGPFGIVVTCRESPGRLTSCIDAIVAQGELARAIVVLDEKLRSEVLTVAGFQTIYTSGQRPAAMAQAGLSALLEIAPDLGWVVHIDQDVRLVPEFARTCTLLFAAHPELGMVSPWILRDGSKRSLETGPESPLLRLRGGDELPFCSAIRTGIAVAPPGSGSGQTAITYPASLIAILPPRGRRSHALPKRRYSGMALIQSQSAQFALLWFMAAPPREKLRWMMRVIRQPGRLLRWIGWRVRHVLHTATPGKPK